MLFIRTRPASCSRCIHFPRACKRVRCFAHTDGAMPPGHDLIPPSSLIRPRDPVSNQGDRYQSRRRIDPRLVKLNRACDVSLNGILNATCSGIC